MLQICIQYSFQDDPLRMLASVSMSIKKSLFLNSQVKFEKKGGAKEIPFK